jgi:acyl-CoA synthetase (AMP-forming)/AMP-acid ligase II/aryl carrier-like protein
MQPNPSILYSAINEQSDATPNAPALLAPEKKELSYRKLFAHLESIARQLNQLGFRRGDRIGVVLPNGPEMATVFLAVSSVCTCAPLNPAYQVDEFSFGLRDLRVIALITSFGNDHPAYKAAKHLGIPILSLEPDTQTAGLFTISSTLSIGIIQSEPVIAELADIALVLHTSGTTFRPKIVPLTHRNIYFSVHNIVDTYSLASSDRCLNMMPLFHIHGLIGALSASLIAGASIICAPGLISEQVVGWLSDLSPTWFTAVPTIHQAILAQMQRQPEKVQTQLRFIRSCSSSLPPPLARELEATFGVPVLEAYGMTEATHQMASNPLPPKARKFGSVGLPTGSTEISIMNEMGLALPRNSLGEICIKGENAMVGYENNPVANASSFFKGWLRTGDRGFIDDEGYLFIQGRIKELINRGGEKISPREIDEVLLGHPVVKEAVTFAVPHPTLGEDVAAAVVFRQGYSISMQELRLYVAGHLADYKVPRQIIFLREIPKGPTGKIQRIGLAEKLKTELDKSLLQETKGPCTPSTLVEKELLPIWQRVLNMDQISVQDDFLAKGGDSIKAASLLQLVHEFFKVELTFMDIFNAPTIALMAEMITKKQGQGNSHD